jgi:anti-sigma factor RsiW
MTDPHETSAHQSGRDDRLDAYLDGQLDERERAAFAVTLRQDPTLRRQAELQGRIDGALGRLFHVEQPSRSAIAAALAHGESPATESATLPTALPLRGTRLYWSVAAAAAAAAVAWALVAGPWSAREDGPAFAARPLVEIYQDAVASGFEPSYECHEAERFAATFSERQGQPLQLLAMPADSRMLGLAYVGGLSRQTTAMLCVVDGQPVMAFVDRASADQAGAAAVGDTKLHIFRQERDGLVFYEVTPLDQPRVLDFLAAPVAAGDAAA